MFQRKDDEVVRAPYSKRVLMDVLGAARRPDSYAVMLLDMSAAEAFRAEYRKNEGLALTNLHLIIKAFALMLEKNPWMNYMVDKYRIIQPSSIDIGVSVAADESVTPVVVVKNANKKSLRTICVELRREAERAIKQERENLQKLDRWGRWVPFDFPRRRLIQFLANRYWVRRTFIGTAQVTSLGFRDLDFHLPSHLGTTMLLSVGGVRRRPVAVAGRVEVRPTAYVAFQVDTRVLNAKKAMRAFRRFRRSIERPQELELMRVSDD